MNNFLPVNQKDMYERGWEQPDFVYISGDAYVDHPSFGASIITRVLEAKGYKVAVLSQPDWRTTKDFEQFGKPRLGYFISSGNIDSMVAHYTVAKKPRSVDAYTAGGQMGKRPDRAVIVYSNIVKQLYPDVPVIIGGLEASLRRFAHYDYWDDAVRPSILLDSKADLLIFGMGENQTIEIAERAKALTQCMTFSARFMLLTQRTLHMSVLSVRHLRMFAHQKRNMPRRLVSNRTSRIISEVRLSSRSTAKKWLFKISLCRR